ncbi:MAG: hypothetical protein Q9181_006504 [Wetmoreana brouardii]
MPRRYKNAEIITGPFAKVLIERADLLEPDQEQLTVLDNACGTGVVAAALHDALDQSTKDRMELICGDLAAPMLNTVKERIETNGWPNTKGQHVDAQAGLAPRLWLDCSINRQRTQKTRLPDEHFTHVLTNFAIMGLQEPTAALNECFRILKPGGICAFTTWAHVGWVAELRAAIATLPGPPPFPDDLTMMRSWGDGGDWHSANWIRSHLSDSQKYNFIEIDVEAVEKDPEMESPAVFVDTFSVMVPVLLKRFWSEQERKEKGDMVLPALLKHMNERYGEGKPFRMRWIANVVTAVRPIGFTLGTARKAEKVSGRSL